MPLTRFQRELLALLATGRTEESRHDLDFFHDSSERVASTFAQDRERLEASGYELDVLLSQPGFIRAVVRQDGEATQVDWAHDSAWRFMSLVRDELGGFLLHEIDLAVPFDLVEGKRRWIEALDQAEAFIGSRPTDEVGCLYWSRKRKGFEAPSPGRDLASQGLTLHFGRPGGVAPRPTDQGLAGA